MSLLWAGVGRYSLQCETSGKTQKRILHIMNIAINIICVYLAREKVIKINLFCGDKANRRADPAAEYRRKQGASGLEDLRPETESGIGDLYQLVEIRAFPGANRHPLQNAVKKLRQLRDIAARGQFALRLPLLQKLG